MLSLLGHTVRLELAVMYVGEILLCFGIAYAVIPFTGAQRWPSSSGHSLALAGVFLGCTNLSLVASGLYDSSAWRTVDRLLAGTIIAATLFGLLVYLTLVTFAPWPSAARGSALGALVLVFALVVFTTRLAFVSIDQRGFLRRRLAVLEASTKPRPSIPSVDDGPRTPLLDSVEVVLTVPAGALLERALAPERLNRLMIWAVIVPDGVTLPSFLLGRLTEAGIRIFGAADFRERCLYRVDVRHLPKDWLANARAMRQGRLEAVTHRGFDLGIGLALLFLALPVLLLTAVAVMLDSGRPVLYRQERVGKGGRVFTLYKFRSMVADAEPGGISCWARADDPRVTRVGRVIRRTHIDELPQILNVLRGDMALVGPRPERPSFVEYLGRAIPHYDDRATIKPGITGWAQVHYPYGASVQDAEMKLSYDLYYLARKSLLMDALILFATIKIVVFQEGAR